MSVEMGGGNRHMEGGGEQTLFENRLIPIFVKFVKIC